MVRWVKIHPDLAGRFAGEMDHAQSAGDHNGRQLRHLVRAGDKASATTRPTQLGVPNASGTT
jgi:hypothetical protein